MRCRVPRTLWGAIAILGATLPAPLTISATATPISPVPRTASLAGGWVSAQDPGLTFDLNPSPVPSASPVLTDYVMDLNTPLASPGDISEGERWPGQRQGISPADSTCVRVPADRQGQGSTLEDPLWNLVALMPSTHMVQTLRPYPTFFWYVPPTTAHYAQFSLYTTDLALRPDRLLYRTSFRIDGQGGIASITVPSRIGVPPLERDRPYGWSLSLYCANANSPADPTGLSLGIRIPGEGRSPGRSPAPLEAPGSFDGGIGDRPNRLQIPLTEQSVSGFVRRIAPPADWSPPATKAHGSSSQWLQSYQTAELWWDAMGTIAHQCCCGEEMRLTNSADPWVQSWRELLSVLDLDALALQPLLFHCPSSSRSLGS